MNLNPTFGSIFLATALVSSAAAAPKKFVIDNQKLAYRNVASIESVADFETFTGKTNAVSGWISYDAATKKGSGKIVVDPATIDTGIPLRNEHMRSAGWLDTSKYPQIVFEAVKVQPTRGDEYKVTGNFTLHGVTKKVSTTVRVRYKAQGPATKAAGFDGDVVQLSTKFAISLDDYGISIPANAAGKVAKEVTISLSTYAIAN